MKLPVQLAATEDYNNTLSMMWTIPLVHWMSGIIIFAGEVFFDPFTVKTPLMKGPKFISPPPMVMIGVFSLISEVNWAWFGMT